MMKVNRTSVRLNGERGDYIATPEVNELCYIHDFWTKHV